MCHIWTPLNKSIHPSEQMMVNFYECICIIYGTVPYYILIHPLYSVWWHWKICLCHPPLPLYTHSLLLFVAQHGYLWLEGNILFFSYNQLHHLNSYSQMSVQELFIWIMHCAILLYYMNIWIMNNLDVPRMLWASTKLLFPHQIVPSLA